METLHKTLDVRIFLNLEGLAALNHLGTWRLSCVSEKSATRGVISFSAAFTCSLYLSAFVELNVCKFCSKEIGKRTSSLNGHHDFIKPARWGLLLECFI